MRIIVLALRLHRRLPYSRGLAPGTTETPQLLKPGCLLFPQASRLTELASKPYRHGNWNCGLPLEFFELEPSVASQYCRSIVLALRLRRRLPYSRGLAPGTTADHPPFPNPRSHRYEGCGSRIQGVGVKGFGFQEQGVQLLKPRDLFFALVISSSAVRLKVILPWELEPIFAPQCRCSDEIRGVSLQ